LFCPEISSREKPFKLEEAKVAYDFYYRKAVAVCDTKSVKDLV